ncbi:hypothetical protein BGX29_012291 [Mortierella sp. GBA35]|nr:hypothetical protein BGX29_012291 [Mortierella sp. GBA35]
MDKEDLYRDYLSRFISGLEQFYDSLHMFHLPPSQNHVYLTRANKCAVLFLAIRCLILQTILNVIMTQLPKNICTTFNQLFFPTVLLFRYLHPKPWDDMFLNTVRALGSDTRVDIAAKPGPRYFDQLQQYLYRTVQAYFMIGIIHQLVNLRGLWAWLGGAVAALVTQQYLQYKGVSYSMVKTLAAMALIGPRWAVWIVQISVQQQLFLYELLQPYLVRVQFKLWEERAWWDHHSLELRGFALGAWALCSVPVVGVIAVPVMFPAVAFLLSRSCGLMENSGRGLSGDVVEARTPGVKAVAQGKSPAVSGDWDKETVTTFVRGSNLKTLKPTIHGPNLTTDQVISGMVTEEQVQADAVISHSRRQDLYQEYQLQLKRQRQFNQLSQLQHPHQHQQHSSGHFGSVAAPVSTSGITAAAAHTTSTPEIVASMVASTPVSAPVVVEEADTRDLSQYDFSDRKTVDTAPSAPPAATTFATDDKSELGRRLELEIEAEKRSRAQEMLIKRLAKLVQAEDALRRAEKNGGVEEAASEEEDEEDEEEEDDEEEEESKEDEDESEDNQGSQDDEDNDSTAPQSTVTQSRGSQSERERSNGAPADKKPSDHSSHKDYNKSTSLTTIDRDKKPLPFLPEEYIAAAIMGAKANVMSRLSTAAEATKAVTGAAAAVSAATTAAAAAASSISSNWRAKAPITRGGLSAIIAQNLLDIEGEIDREFLRTKKAWKAPREHVVDAITAAVEEGASTTAAAIPLLGDRDTSTSTDNVERYEK